MKTLLVMASILTASSSYAGKADLTSKVTVVGIGVAIDDKVPGTIEIIQVLPGSPASNVGLLPGDEIKSVQPLPGTPAVLTAGKTLEQVVYLIRGPVGTEETLVVKRKNAEHSFSLKRAPIAQ